MRTVAVSRFLGRSSKGIVRQALPLKQFLLPGWQLLGFSKVGLTRAEQLFASPKLMARCTRYRQRF